MGPPHLEAHVRDILLRGVVKPVMRSLPLRLAPIALLLALPAASALAQSRPSMAAGGDRHRVAVRGRVSGDDIIRTARQFLGVPYRWGGTTPRAFDCSGFVRHVFAQYGIALPRTAREQAGVGSAPFPGDLQPGDLLFFYGARDGSGAQHIAIFVGGDTIIHASSSARRVRYDRLSGAGADRSWFRQRLVAVRRLLPAEGVFYVPTTGAATAAAPDARMARELTSTTFVF